MALFRRETRTLKKPSDLETTGGELEESLQQAKDAYASLESQRPWVESLVQVLTRRNQLNNFGDEVTIAFTPRRSPNASPDPSHP